MSEKTSFGPFCLDMHSARLYKDRVDLKLRAQASFVLRTLVRKTGEYVTYEDLIKDAWSGNIVSQHTVATTVGDVRRALGEYGYWIGYRPKLGYRFQIPGSEELIRMGQHLMDRLTREGFEKAISYFQRAIEVDGSDFRAHERLSMSYMLMGLFGMQPMKEMYKQFVDAHSKAVTLAGLTTKLRVDRAFALHIVERKFNEAESEFLQALHEDPELPLTYLCLSLLYVTLGRLDKALEVLENARRIDPLLPTLTATEVLIRLCRREFSTAVSCGKQGLDLHPYLHIERAYYAQALEYAGQAEAALVQYRLSHAIAPDSFWVRALEGRCLAKLGREAEAETILEELHETRAAEYLDPYYMALLLDALGKRDDAIEELDRAIEENSATLYMLDVDPKMDNLRTDRRFAKLRRKVFRDAAST